MPSIFYGYSPEDDEPDISFSSVPENRDSVFKAPLNDMSTNPSSPLFQAMNNQRGPTYAQELAETEENEPDVSFSNALEGGFSQTPIGQAMNNANNAKAMTVNADEAQSLEDYLEATNQDATLSGEGGDMGNQDIDGFDYVDPGMGTSEPVAATADPVDPGGRTVPGAEGSAFSMRDGVVINPYAGEGGARSEIEVEGGTINGGVDGLGESIKNSLDEAGQRGRAQVPVDAPPVLPVDGTAPGGRVGDPSAPTGGSDFMSSSGLSLSDVLTEAGYDVGALTKEYGNIFEEYDPTREQFARRRDTLSEAGLDLQRGSAQLDLQRTQGQLGRQAQSLRARQADVAEDLAMQQQLFGLQEEERATGLSRLREGARGNLFGLYRQQDVTGGFAGAGARNMALDRARRAFTADVGGRISSLADTRRSDIAIQQAERSSARQQRQLGSQLSGVEAELGEQGFLQRAFENRLAGFDLSRQEQRLGLEQNVFGLRKDYESDVRGRLIDIIKSGGDLDKFKLREEMKGPNETDTGISGYNSFYDNIYNEPRERFN